MDKEKLLGECVKEAKELGRKYMTETVDGEFPTKEEWQLAMVLFERKLNNAYMVGVDYSATTSTVQTKEQPEDKPVAVKPLPEQYKNMLPHSVVTGNTKKDDTQKCSACGASQLRQNGTCQLCEVCGETTGCS